MWAPLLMSVQLTGVGGVLFGDCPRRSVVEQLDREVLACQVRLEQAAEASRSCGEGDGATSLYRELLQAFADTEVDVVRDGPRVVASVPSALLFPSDGVEVRREARLVVDLLGTALNLHPETAAWVVAHTDDAPLNRTLQRQFADPLGLTQAQAASVVRTLVTDFSVDAGRLVAAGHGSARPKVPAETDGARQQNRRVDIVIGPREDWR